jgi:rubredoxin
MPYWMCHSCGHCLKVSDPPDECPHCFEKCSFRDVTCYRPECGGESNIDPLLTGAYTHYTKINRLG